MAETNDDVVIAEVSSTVGQRLRETREVKKITIAEVSAQLRLTKESIRYLEENQWDKLHGRAYARGYFSSYVNFLSLPQDELLAAFNIEYKASEPEVVLHQLTPQKKPKLAPFLLIIAVLVLTWLAYQQWQVVNVEVKNDNEEVEAVVEPAIMDAFSSSVVEPLAEPILAESGESLTDIEHVTEEASANLVEQTLEKVEDVVTESQSQLENADETVITNDVVTTNATIELQFSEDSWIEVTDADGQVLTKKIGKENESITLSGHPPIAVLLGRATGVTVKYNGEEIDITDYIKNDVARFGLGVIE